MEGERILNNVNNMPLVEYQESYSLAVFEGFDEQHVDVGVLFSVIDDCRTNGLLFFSAPIVVKGPWPGMTRVLSGRVAYNRSLMEATMESKLPPIRSVRPMLP